MERSFFVGNTGFLFLVDSSMRLFFAGSGGRGKERVSVLLEEPSAGAWSGMRVDDLAWVKP
jgi:hypothetical protein